MLPFSNACMYVCSTSMLFSIANPDNFLLCSVLFLECCTKPMWRCVHDNDVPSYINKHYKSYSYVESFMKYVWIYLVLSSYLLQGSWFNQQSSLMQVTALWYQTVFVFFKQRNEGICFISENVWSIHLSTHEWVVVGGIYVPRSSLQDCLLSQIRLNAG